MKNQLIIGSDHGGFALKTQLIAMLEEISYGVQDVGCFSQESVHYPEIARKVAMEIATGRYQKGILICGTGIGMSMAANRFNQVRAALCHDHFTARMSREHNDSNILVLGGRVTGIEVAKEILETWLTTSFQGGRHQERIQMFETIALVNPKD